MKCVPSFRVLGPALIGLVAVGCGGDQTPEFDGRATGSVRAALEVEVDDLNVGGVHFLITGADGRTYERTLPLQTGPAGSILPEQAGRRFADWLVVLPVGPHTILATPVDENGEPLPECQTAKAEVEVLEGVTVELTLVSNCKVGETGGVDTTVIVNQIPVITGIETPTTKFVCRDEAFIGELTARDDNDELVWTFSLESTPDGQFDAEPCLAWTDGRVALSSPNHGRYELRAEVSDGLAATSLVFPVYINDCGQPICPGLQIEADAGMFDNTAGECSCEMPTVTVSQNVQPAIAVVEPVTQGELARPVARYQAPDNRTVDFVEQELIVATDDPAALAEFVARWNAEILGVVDPATVGGLGPAYYRTRIDLSRADLTALEAKWARANGVTGQQVFSSANAVLLLAAALAETDKDSPLRVSFNPILSGADFSTRSVAEEATGPAGYSADAYAWPYMNRASQQDIGTAEAWTLLDSVGRLSTRVRMGIADGGFIVNQDFPTGTIVAGSERIPNPSSCSGSPCPWHGTQVALSAAAQVDNGLGVAGPAGPIAELTVLPSPAPDFFAYIEYIFLNIPAGIAGQPHIINISASIDMPSEVCLGALIGLPVCEVLHGVTGAFRAAGTLIFAAAGNDSKDVDRTKQFGLCPFCITEEQEITIPCELDGVICVGGINWDSDQKDSGSAFGSNPASAGSVDIYGPYDVWSINDPAAADDDLTTPNTAVARISGTSFASPYVAGVAGLIWAANPSLSAAQVENLLLSTAHTTSGDARVHRWVNALAGVQRALGQDTPPFLRVIDRPFSVPEGASILLSAAVEELQGQPVSIEWSRAGTLLATGSLAAGAFRGTNRVTLDTSSWPTGTNVIDVVGTDSVGNRSAVYSVAFELTPVVTPPVSRTVSLGATGSLCPQDNGEPGDTGDAEFNGSPQIQVDVELTISGDRRNLVAEIFFRGTELGGDTQVVETFTRTVASVAAGEQILSIDSPRSFNLIFMGLGGGAEFGICSDGTVETRDFSTGPVSRLQVIADTGAGDVSNDSNCHCDTRIENILFTPAQLTVAVP